MLWKPVLVEANHSTVIVQVSLSVVSGEVERDSRFGRKQQHVEFGSNRLSRSALTKSKAKRTRISRLQCSCAYLLLGLKEFGFKRRTLFKPKEILKLVTYK